MNELSAIEQLTPLFNMVRRLDPDYTLRVTNLEQPVNEVFNVLVKNGSPEVNDMDKYQKFINRHLPEKWRNDTFYSNAILEYAKVKYDRHIRGLETKY